MHKAGETIDCAIIGGGAAGLTAATYLGRFRRSCVVFDDGRSRVLQIPRSRNVPGFPDGVSGLELHRRMSIQAEHYGRGLVCKRVEVLQRTDTGFVLRTASQTTHARAVILATGVAVTPPQMEALPEAVATGVIRYCPICDGFEVTDKRIAVLGSKQASIEEALFLRTYAADITFLKAVDFDMSAEEAQAAQQNGIRLEQRTLQTMFLAEGGLLVRYADGQSDRFDVLYPCLGSVPRSRLACSVGAEVTPSGGLLVDSRQQTNVPMLYAAGDVLEGLDQIASACGQAAIAATAIHNHLRKA